jgi:hypothetical protein
MVNDMNAPPKMPSALASLALLLLSTQSFAGRMDGIVGDWKLNPAKSKFDPAPAMKELETKVTDAGKDTYHVESTWTEGDGTPGHFTFTSALDGKPVPVSGYDAVDSVKLKQISPTTLKAVFTKDGKVIETETQTLSADGKTVHDVDTGLDDKGKRFTDHIVLERQ